MRENNNSYITVLEIEESYRRGILLFKTLVFALVSFVLMGFMAMSLYFPLITVTNDFESSWSVSGMQLISGILLDGVVLSSFNLLGLLIYIFTAVALLGLGIYFVINIISAVKAAPGEELVVLGKRKRLFRMIIGAAALIASLMLMLIDPVYQSGVTADGKAYMEVLSANFSFNIVPTAYGVLLTIFTFFIGTYYLCSAIKDTKFWSKYQGAIYIAGIVALLLYLWQYGFLHRAFGIDPASSTFPYPFPKAINSQSKFTGGVKGSYNSVFGSLAAVFVASSTDVLNDSILYNAGTTVGAMLIGFVVGGIIGYVIAIVASSGEKWGKGVLVVCTILVAFPVVALGPIVNHLFPSNSYLLSFVAKIIVVTILCMAGMTINAFRGLTALKPFTMDLMSINNASKKQILFELQIPNSLPFVFTALKANSATALMASFVCEFYSRSKTLGLGMMFNNYWSTARYQSWAYIIMSIVFGLILYLVVASVEKRCISWHPSVRKK